MAGGFFGFPKSHRAVWWWHAARKSNYSAVRLATQLGMSPRQLQRTFKLELGRTPQDWLDEQRMVAAVTLLSEGLPIKRVAFELGYKDVGNFRRHFKRIFKESPSVFIERRIERSRYWPDDVVISPLN